MNLYNFCFEAVGDFQYLDTIFKVGNEYYYGLVNGLPLKKGVRLKDITKTRNITQDISSSYGKKPKSTFLRDVSMNSIANAEQKVNDNASQVNDENRDVETAADQDARESRKLNTEQTGTSTHYLHFPCA